MTGYVLPNGIRVQDRVLVLNKIKAFKRYLDKCLKKFSPIPPKGKPSQKNIGNPAMKQKKLKAALKYLSKKKAS